MRRRLLHRHVAVLLSMLLASCGGDDGGWFVVVTDEAGIDFHHRHCGSGEKQLIEMNGGAAAVLDYDGDGLLDLYFAQGAPLPGFDGTGVDLRDRLFRNVGDVQFVDVTEEANCSEESYTFSAQASDAVELA